MRRQVQVTGFCLPKLDGIQELPGPSAGSRLAALTLPKLGGMMNRSQPTGLW